MVNVTHFDEPFVRKSGRVSTTTPRTLYLPGKEEQAVEIDTRLLAAMACGWQAFCKLPMPIYHKDPTLKIRAVLSMNFHH
jgi:hypothetical protein